MNQKTLLIILISLIGSFISNGEILRETRAVWVTTNFQLDWPPKSFDEDEQKNKLREIFIDLKQKNINTVYFQVRSNGTVMYNSNIEPYSPYITGEVGSTPTYDPLQYAIELGREFNLEVHAWVNMIRCFSGSDERFLRHPNHIRNTHPEWTERVMDENGRLSYWLNPGHIKSQDYLVDLLLELSNNYDIDGIHLDFFRYPGENFEDAKYFKNNDLNLSLEDWRRNNLTAILRKFKERVTPINPFLKVGATPIGIRKSLNGANGWEGYSSVFQDTERWLKESLVDYLTPQIYWDFEKNPRFDVLAKDWVDKAYNKNIILGLAAYKKDVLPELENMIKLSREIGASGISFFRYENISDKSFQYFSQVSFPKNMPWKEDKTISVTSEIVSEFKPVSEDEIIIYWNDSNKEITKTFRKYALLNNTTPIKLLSLTKDKVKLKFGNPSKLMYNYSISKIDRLWNYTSLSNTLLVSVPFLYHLKKSAIISSRPFVYEQNENNFLLSITSHYNQKAILDIITKENLRKQIFAELNVGFNIIPFDEKLSNLRSIIITYSENNEQQEVTFF